MSTVITTLIDNCAGEGLAAENGLSLWIEKDGLRVLFDCGQSGAFIDNAQKLGIDVGTAGRVVFSHNHYDHTRGFRRFIAENPPCADSRPLFERFQSPASGRRGDYLLYLGHPFFTPKFWDHEEGFLEYTGCAFTQAELMAWGVPAVYLRDEVTELSPESGMFLLTAFPRNNPQERTDSFSKRLRGGELIEDDYRDEAALVIETGDGPVLISGCSHSGIIDICEAARRRFGPLTAVVGGCHLVVAEEERIAATVDYINRNVPIAQLCHCTGEAGLAAFRERGTSFVPGGAGAALQFS